MNHPELPVPLLVEFPFPAWATAAAEAGPPKDAKPMGDPFDGLARVGRAAFLLSVRRVEGAYTGTT